MSKAFDRIPHRYLIEKLDALGFRGNILRPLGSYLDDRFQTISVKGVLSDPMAVESGTPQGGVLYGLLFALYINDLPEVTKYANIYIYADNVKLMKKINSTEDIKKLQYDIDSKAIGVKHGAYH